MISERVYRALLALHPREHVREYGEPMVQLFRDRMHRDGGGLRTAALWVEMLVDLVYWAFRERSEAAVLEDARTRSVVARSAVLLFWALVGGSGLYLLVTVGVLTAGLVALTTGWYPVVVESGPLAFLGYTVHIDTRSGFDGFDIMVAPSWPGFPRLYGSDLACDWS